MKERLPRRDRGGLAVASRELLGLSESISSTQIVGDADEYLSAVAKATSLEDDFDKNSFDGVVRCFRAVSERDLVVLWERWLKLESLFLHVLIPRVLISRTTSTETLAFWVLEAGLEYPDPSFNRYFIQAAIRRLGLCSVLQRLLEFSKELDEPSLRKAAAAYYWAFYDWNDLSGAEPQCHDRELERALRKELRRRLKPVAPYLKRWWQW